MHLDVSRPTSRLMHLDVSLPWQASSLSVLSMLLLASSSVDLDSQGLLDGVDDGRFIPSRPILDFDNDSRLLSNLVSQFFLRELGS